MRYFDLQRLNDRGLMLIRLGYNAVLNPSWETDHPDALQHQQSGRKKRESRSNGEPKHKVDADKGLRSYLIETSCIDLYFEG